MTFRESCLTFEAARHSYIRLLEGIRTLVWLSDAALVREGCGGGFFGISCICREDETERAFKKIMPFLIQNVNPDGVAYRKIK